VRIGLVNEGTYPVVAGGVSTWCHQLVSGMDEHEWHLLAITGGQATSVWPRPAQVASTTYFPMWGAVPAPPVGWRYRSRHRRAVVAEALDDFWRFALPVEPFDVRGGARLEGTVAALWHLAEPHDVPLAALLAIDGSAPAILRAWSGHRHGRPHLPTLSVADATQAAALVDRALALLDLPWPEVDVVHAAANGPAALVAMVRSWRHRIPMVLTEHGVYLRERYLAMGDLPVSWSVRYAVLSALRAICTLAYAHASLVLPVSRFNARWQHQLGADPARIFTIHNGVDGTAFEPIDDEPAVPTISFVGRIDPLKDLETLVEAFALVRPHVPQVRLRIFGPCPAGNEHYRDQVAARASRLGVDDALTWEGPVDGSVPAIRAGHVVALSSISEGLPFTVMEAMFCGRATVSTDVGGVNEVVGRDGTSGLLVPPRDPKAMAGAFHELLVDHARRAAMGRAARRRALDHFELGQCIDQYRLAYDLCTSSSDDLVHDLTDAARQPGVAMAAAGFVPARSPAMEQVS
jgi:glycosyltransferase involved in cell wall biosynthesis